MSTQPPGAGARKSEFPDAQAGLEQNELRRWVELAADGVALSNCPSELAGHLLCRLPFNIFYQDRLGREQMIKVHTRTLGAHSAVLYSRRPLPLFAVVQMQYDDGTECPRIRTKVLGNEETVGGYLVHLEHETVDQAKQSADAPGSPPAASSAPDTGSATRASQELRSVTRAPRGHEAVYNAERKPASPSPYRPHKA